MKDGKMAQIYMTDQRISELTGIPLQTLRNWRHKRMGPPYVKLGRAVRYKLDDVLQFMEDRKVETESF